MSTNCSERIFRGCAVAPAAPVAQELQRARQRRRKSLTLRWEWRGVPCAELTVLPLPARREGGTPLVSGGDRGLSVERGDSPTASFARLCIAFCSRVGASPGTASGLQVYSPLFCRARAEKCVVSYRSSDCDVTRRARTTAAPGPNRGETGLLPLCLAQGQI